MLALIAFLVFLYGRAVRASDGRPNRVVQYLFYRVESLETYRKGDRKFRSASEVLASGGAPALQHLVRRIAPSQVGWLSSRFPTDKGNHHNYLAIYDGLFAPYVDRKNLFVLEVGVKKGGSLALWRELFHESAFIYGIDINPDVPTFTRDGHIKVLVLDSEDELSVFAALGDLRFDIVIDDGAHRPGSQRMTFAALRGHLSPTGIYIIEDVEALDTDAYLRHGVDVAVFPDPSGQKLVVLCPPASLARQTEEWRRGEQARLSPNSDLVRGSLRGTPPAGTRAAPDRA